MQITRSSSEPATTRFLHRIGGYTLFGTATFLLDLTVLWLLLHFTALPTSLAIIMAFMLAIHVNYVCQSFFVYSQSKETKSHTYPLFVFTMLLIALFIPLGVDLVQHITEVGVMTARLLTSGVFGLISFIFNTFFNFKVL